MNTKIKNYLTALFFGISVMAGLPQTADAQNKVATTKTRGARDIVKEIIDVVGLTARFEMREANIDNAAAVIANGRRYILYNSNFLNAVNNASKTDWASVSILAHEIGHHLNGHTLISGGSNRTDELEADEFSGFVLRKMGASLADAQAAMAVLSDDRETSTHPGRSMRLAAISTGWKNANTQMMAAYSPVSDKPVQVTSARKVEASGHAPVTATYPSVMEETTLNSSYILTKVTFKNAPRESFYITTRGNLVRVKDNQVEVIGALSQTFDATYPFVFKGSKIDPLYISKTGYIYNQSGKKLGWLSS